MSMPDLPRTNVELHVLPAPARTRDRLTRLASDLQGIVAEATGSSVAVRIAQLDAATYVVLK